MIFLPAYAIGRYGHLFSSNIILALEKPPASTSLPLASGAVFDIKCWS